MQGLTVDIDAVLDRQHVGDCGIEGSAELLTFADAVLGGTASGVEPAAARAALRARLGEEALWEAAATVAAFCGLVRVADGTGIPLDDGVLAVSAEVRERTGIDGFAGAANSSTTDAVDVSLTDVAALFR